MRGLCDTPSNPPATALRFCNLLSSPRVSFRRKFDDIRITQPFNPRAHVGCDRTLRHNQFTTLQPERPIGAAGEPILPIRRFQSAVTGPELLRRVEYGDDRKLSYRFVIPASASIHDYRARFSTSAAATPVSRVRTCSATSGVIEPFDGWRGRWACRPTSSRLHGC